MEVRLGLVLFVLTFTWSLIVVNGKVVSGRGYSSPGYINEVTKFNFGIGKGKIEGEFSWYGNTPKAKVYLFMDTIWWDQFHVATDDACDKVKHAHSQFSIGDVGERINSGIGKATGHEAGKNEKRKMVWPFEWEIQHHVRTYGWYVVVADCSHQERGDEKPKTQKRKSKFRFYYDITLLNEGGSHLSRDEAWIFEFNAIVLLVLAAGAFKIRSDHKKNSYGGKTHMIIHFLWTAYYLQVASILLEIIHQWSYGGNGKGIFFFDLLSEMLEGFSQSVLSFLLIAVSHGWTLVQSSNGGKNRHDPSMSEVLANPSLMDIENPMVFILLLFAMISTVLQIVNKIYDDSFMKFHDHETTAGFFLVFIRFGLGVVFAMAFRNTIAKEEKRGNMNLVGFMKMLALFGSIWFFAFPGIVMLASLWAHYLRHFFVTIGVLVAQSCCLIGLMYQFLSNKSAYARHSEVSSSGGLPIGGLGGYGNKYH